MNVSSLKQLFTGLVATTLLSSTATIALADPSLAYKQLDLRGLGPIRVGMTVNQAAQAAGTRLIPNGPAPGSSCYYVRPANGPAGVDFMVDKNRIVRVDVQSDRVTTLGGAKASDTTARIQLLYPGQIQVSPHKYNPNGRYLTLMPRDDSDRNYRLIFETEQGRVTQYRSGLRPYVEQVERCG